MMRENCAEIHTIIDSWEENGALSAEEYELLRNHLVSCAECRGRYEALLPLLRRDAGVEAGAVMIGKPGGAADFADAVMDRIDSGREHEFSSKKRNVFPLAAAAAALFIVGGLVFRFLLFSPGPAGEGLRPRDTQYVQISFELTAPEAEEVHLVGDFTEWESSKITLKDPDGDGVWEAEVKLRKGDVYSYNFVIDGEEWIPDPNSLTQVDDGFGGKSSLLSL